jgi:hypothetical protein
MGDLLPASSLSLRISETSDAVTARIAELQMLVSPALDPRHRLERGNGLLFDRCVGTRPLSNWPSVPPPPRPSLVLRPPNRRVLPRLLPAERSEVEQLKGGQHGFDPSPLGFIRLENLAAIP